MAMWLQRSSHFQRLLILASRTSGRSFLGVLSGHVFRQDTVSVSQPYCLVSRLHSSSTIPFFRESSSAQRHETTKASLAFDDGVHEDAHSPHLDNNQGMDFPGGRLLFTSDMNFIPESEESRVPCFHVLNDYGRLISSTHLYHHKVSKEMSVNIYRNMVSLQVMDTIFSNLQRAGRLSIYLASHGEEAITISSAAAFSPEDYVFAQYREPGVLLWRGFSLQEFANQCFGNKADYGKGRQMPIHYGSNKHKYFTISSPIATQLPQAVGAAYSLKMEKKDACVAAYFGEGTTSEGDFHAALNFAAVLEAPVVFVCRNNGWAISTPVSEQFRSDGVVVKGRGYGIRSIRVDGNDALAIYNVMKMAREMAIREQRPILVEAMTYRVAPHAASDDCTRYRPLAEVEEWKTLERDPLVRFRRWIEGNGWWAEKDEVQLRSNIEKEMIEAIQAAEKMEKPKLSELFMDVYDQQNMNLEEQEKFVREAIERHPKVYPSAVPL